MYFEIKLCCCEKVKETCRETLTVDIKLGLEDHSYVTTIQVNQTFSQNTIIILTIPY